MSRQKIARDRGGVVYQHNKPEPMRVKRRGRLPPEVHQLVHKYLRKKEMNEVEEDGFMIVGPEKKLYL